MFTVPEFVLPAKHLPSSRQVRDTLAMERAFAQPSRTAALVQAATASGLLDAATFVAACRTHGSDRVVAVSQRFILRTFRRLLGKLAAYGAFEGTSSRANQPAEFDSDNGIVLSLPCSPCLITLTFASRPISDKAVLYCALRIIGYYLSPFYFAGIDPPLYEECGFAYHLRELREAGWLDGETFTPTFGDWQAVEHTEFYYRYESCDTDSLKEHVEELLRTEQWLTGDWRRDVDRGLARASKRKRHLQSCAGFLSKLNNTCQDQQLKAWVSKLVIAIQESKQDASSTALLRGVEMEWEEGYCDYAFGTAVVLERYGIDEAEQCLSGVCESESPALRLRLSSPKDFVKLRPALKLLQTGVAALYELIELEE